jgi:hypothetical protein
MLIRGDLKTIWPRLIPCAAFYATGQSLGTPKFAAHVPEKKDTERARAHAQEIREVKKLRGTLNQREGER